MTSLRIADNVISTPLCYAARMGKIDLVCQLIKKGHVNVHDNRGWAPLHEAVAAGHTDCAKLLLQHEECNVDACTFEGMSPLFVACQYQNKLELIKILIDHGASINKANNENETPLHVACKSYKLEIVKVLVKHGANVNYQDFNNFTPLMDAIDQVGTMWNKRQETPFEEVHFLLENGGCIKLTDLHGRTSLLIAACEKWYECVQLLVQYGSDVNASTEDGTTAIMLAAQANDLPVVKFLLDSGAEPDISCKNGRMPLHHALHNGFMSTAEELINKMDLKEIFERKEKIDSFLIVAIDSGSFESFNFVIKHKLYSAVELAPFENPHSICPLNYEYHTPLTFLLQHHIENPHGKLMMEILLETGDFHVNAPKIGCIPPLIALISSPCIEKCMEHIKLECFFNLLEKGANIDYCNTERNKQLPDAIVTVVRPRRCNVSQIFLLPVLAHCFMCDWDCVLDWVVENNQARSSVVYTLLKLSGKSKQNLWNIWKNLKLCPCDVCKNEAPSIKKCIDEKIMTLQSLCRPIVRQWLWRRTVNSHDAKNILIDMCIPLPVREYIIPIKL